MITDIVIALAIFFIGIPLAMGALAVLLRMWWLWLVPLGVFILVMTDQQSHRVTPSSPVTKGSSFSQEEVAKLRHPPAVTNEAKWEELYRLFGSGDAR
jgi:hypothetical protein